MDTYLRTQINEAKTDCQEAIAEAIKAFEEKTGLDVINIEYEKSVVHDVRTTRTITINVRL